MTSLKSSLVTGLLLGALATASIWQVGAMSAKGHCPIPSVDSKEHLVGAGYNILARKYWKTFDLDNDLREDYHVEYDIIGVAQDHTVQHTLFPTVYYMDLDKDGVYEAIFMDMQGNGRCEDLRPYTGRETNQ